MLPHRPRHITVAVLALLGAHASVMADSTPFRHQERVGLALNVPFSGQGVLFKDATVSLIYQRAEVRDGGRVSGWQLSVGSALQAFSPVLAVSGLVGERCAQGSLGVSYGAGRWGLPVALQGPYVQLGLGNVGGLGGAFAGASTLGCFKRYDPPVAAAPLPPVVLPPAPPPPAPPPPPPAPSPQQQQTLNGAAWMPEAPRPVLA